MNCSKIIFFLLATMIISLLAGCASHSPFQQASFKEDKAMIYVFRPNSAFARGEMLKVTVDGEKQDLLINNAYLPVEVTPGSNEIHVTFNSWTINTKAAININSQPGKRYYIKVEPGIGWSLTLTELDDQQGAAEISSKVLYQQ